MGELERAGLAEREIDGKNYAFQKFGAEKATVILIKLTKMVGKPIAMAIAAIKGDGKLLDRDMNLDILGEAVQALTGALDEKEAMSLIKDLTANGNVLCDGVKVSSFDKHYEGQLDHMFKVLAAALEVQYGNFYSAIAARVPTRRVEAAPTTQEKPTSPIRNG